MKRIGMVLFILIFLSIGCKETKLVSFEGQNGMMGYKDTNGKVVIQPKYVFAESFSRYGLAPVCDPKQNWIYINKNEELVIKPYYIKNDNDFDRFSEGLARFEKEGRIGFFNEKGKVVIKAMFEYASTFKNGLAAVGKNVVMENDGELEFVKSADVGFINNKGILVIPYKFDNIISLFNKKGTAEVVINGKKVLIDTKGNVIKTLK